MRLVLSSMLAAGLSVAPAAADDGIDQITIYAAFAKFEANISELTLAATAFAALDASYADARAEKLEEFEEDIEQVAAYVAMLRAADLTPEQDATLELFAGKWDALTTAGAAMIDGSAAEPADIVALFEKAEAADEAIDDALDDMLDAMGVELPGETG